jgi:hypothetical protein
MKIKHLIIILISFFLIQCSKDDPKFLPAGIETRVSGRITDINNSPIHNVKLKIGEYKITSKGFSIYGNLPDFVKDLELTETDSNGEYNFTFKTSGQGNYYALEIQPSPIDEQKYWNCCYNSKIDNIGNNHYFDYNQLIKLFPCDVTINLNNVTDFPLKVNHETTHQNNNNSNDIIDNNQVVRRIYIKKYNTQTLQISRTKSNAIRQIATYTFPASNVETLSTQNITIKESDFINI